MHYRAFFFSLLLIPATNSLAGQDLIYLEAQGIGGYSSKEHKVIYRSDEPHDVMQKNSLGFDAVHKFSDQTGDRGTASLQMRLAYNDSADDDTFGIQIYNAYLSYKAGIGDLWAGHHRPAFGLTSYRDTHAGLMGNLPMYGVGFDRDWGVGYSRQTADGQIDASLTSGTGMNYRAYGNYLASTRWSYGVLNRDNHTVGLSAMYGKILDTMGYHIESRHKQETFLVGTDLAFNVNRWAHKIELDAGSGQHAPYYAVLYNMTLGLDEDERLFYEVQPVYVRKNHNETVALSNGFSYLLTSNLTARILYRYQERFHDNVWLTQLYWYAPL